MRGPGWSLPVQVGMAAALFGRAAADACAAPLCAALLLVALVLHLSLLNQAPESAYFAQTLQAWEQGRFIRFHGLAQWLGWLWPFAVLAYVLVALSRRDGRAPLPRPASPVIKIGRCPVPLLPRRPATTAATSSSASTSARTARTPAR
jgi:hypothetical protein